MQIDLSFLFPRLLAGQTQILDELTRTRQVLEATIVETESLIMTDLSKLQSDVQASTTVTQSAITLLNGLAEQIRNLPAGDQAAIDQLASDLEAQTSALSAAVVANTPPPAVVGA